MYTIKTRSVLRTSISHMCKVFVPLVSNPGHYDRVTTSRQFDKFLNLNLSTDRHSLSLGTTHSTPGPSTLYPNDLHLSEGPTWRPNDVHHLRMVHIKTSLRPNHPSDPNDSLTTGTQSSIIDRSLKSLFL